MRFFSFLEVVGLTRHVVDDSKAPRFRMPLKNRDIPLGFNITLVCSLTGSPTPLIIWYKNGKQVSAAHGDIKVCSVILVQMCDAS